MKESVVLESSQTYERTSIEHLIQWCMENGRDPTCPVTGKVLKSLEHKPNIGLALAIEEWVNRNVEIQLKNVARYLGEDPPPSMDCIDRALEYVYNISEYYPSNIYKVRNVDIVVLLVKLLRNRSKIIGSTHSRSKVLVALRSLSKDEESKKIMLRNGITRLAIPSLVGSSEKESECAVKLLLEFCSDDAYCIKIASEKGALVLLSGMARDTEHPSLSNLAEDLLKRIERVEDIVEDLAAAGRIEPVLSRLCNGSDDDKIKMAYMVGKMTLTNSSKEQIAKRCVTTLVELLSKPEGKTPSLLALYKLSEMEENVTILVDSAVLPALTTIFLGKDSTLRLRELIVPVIANIVSYHNEGLSMLSRSFVSSLLTHLPSGSPQFQIHILRTLCGIASSPRATDIVSCDGLIAIVQFLNHQGVEHRTHAFRLTRLLLERFGQDVACGFMFCDEDALLKNKLLDIRSTDDERSDAARILANLPLARDDIKSFLGGASFVRWVVTTLKNPQYHNSNATIIEGLLGLLLHFTRSLDPETINVARDHHLMAVFCEQLGSSNPRLKQLAALGLKNLSESCGRARYASSRGLFFPGFGNWMRLSLLYMCPIHSVLCEGQFCLLKNNCIKPLLRLLEDKDTNVRIAAMEALSTLVLDTDMLSNDEFERAVDELERSGVVDAVVAVFTRVGPGELQERLIWVIEKMLRMESLAKRYSLNESLVSALIDAFQVGNTNTKRLARDACIRLKRIPGLCEKISPHTRLKWFKRLESPLVA